MTGGDDPVNIDRWKAVALAEPDERRRAQYGGLALALSDAAARYPVWEDALKGWNMQESQAVTKWIEEGRVEGQATALVAVLEAKFGAVPADLTTTIRGTTDLGKLKEWVTAAARAASQEEFRRLAGVG